MTALVICLATLFCRLGQDPYFDLPDDVRERYVALVERLQILGYVEPGRYDELLETLRSGYLGVARGRSVVGQLTQLMFDHGRGHDWIRDLAFDLERPELQPIAASSIPTEIELDQVLFDDGTTLVGSGGPLSRRFPSIEAERVGEQRTLDPNLGVDGDGDLWIGGERVVEVSRARVPLPRAFLIAGYNEHIDSSGRLAIEGHWFRPGRGVELETVALDAVRVTAGGTWFSNRDLGLTTLRQTWRYPELQDRLDDRAARELGFVDTAPSLEPSIPDELERIVEDLRRRAPAIEWYLPFNPDPSLAQRALDRRDLVDHDPTASLRRLRLFLTYGDDLPPLGLVHPTAMLSLERRVVAYLDGRAVPESEFGADLDAVAAALRHAPHLEVDLPDDYLGDDVLLRVPPDYSPWRKWPVLVALHGQGGAPEHERSAWASLCDDRGVVLLCPHYGSMRGAAQSREADEALLDIIRRATLRLNVDSDRVYLTGVSMGGAKTWHLAERYPGRFAAIAPEIRGPSRWNDRFPLLANVLPLPLFQIETEFDGRNTEVSRAAVDELRRLGGTVEYRELGLLGHVRAPWLYPTVLDWLLGHRRDAHPRRVDHRALHAWQATHAWLTIDEPARKLAWDREDGAFVLADLTGVEALCRGDQIVLRRTKGRAQRVTIHVDPAVMSPSVEVRAMGRRVRLDAAPTIGHMLQQVRRTGDRSRLYVDSISVELR